MASFQVLVSVVLDSNCYISTVLFFLPPTFSTFCVSIYESVYKTKCGISLNLFKLTSAHKPEDSLHFLLWCKHMKVNIDNETLTSMFSQIPVAKTSL